MASNLPPEDGEKTGLLVEGFGAGVAGAEDSAGVVVGEPWTIAPPRRESKRATRN
jgi:hypothetical protein